MAKPELAVQDLGQCSHCKAVVACQGLLGALLSGKLGVCHNCGKPMEPQMFGFEQGDHGLERISVLSPNLALKRRTRHSVMKCPPQSKIALKQEAYWNSLIDLHLRDSEKLYNRLNHGKRVGG